MQFMVYDPNFNPEEATPPTPETMARWEVHSRGVEAGVLVATGALNPKGTRLRLSGGKFTVTDGPYRAKGTAGRLGRDSNQVVGRAIEWCKRFRQIVGDGESEIVQVFGPGDFEDGQHDSAHAA